MNKTAFFLIVIFSSCSAFAQLYSYSRYSECTFDGAPCEQVDFYPENGRIDIRVNIGYFSPRNLTIENADEIYGQSSSCNYIVWGKNPSALDARPVSISNEEHLYIRAEGCRIDLDKWFESRLAVRYEMQDDYYTSGYRDYRSSSQIYLRKFIESNDYQAKERMNLYFFRYIPIAIIAALSLVGLFRVRRC